MSSETVARLNTALSGRYRILSKIGEGGMAVVYLADDLRHERKIALKVLKPELAAVVGGERFLGEIKTTANLQHPHILPLFDSGEADRFLFYVMPYVEGESLRSRLERENQLPVDEAVSITIGLAEALDYAHRQGVIHRDIKPANVLLHEGEPVIADFGIALAVGAAGGGRLTETGLSLGTPHYMSPEQATGDQNVGPPTDVYALGCVLYEMLVGEPPFMGGSAQAVLGRIITSEAPSATTQRKAVPPNVDAVIRRALEKVPADRFSGAHGFAHALTVPGFRHGNSPREAARRASPAAVGLGVLGGAVVATIVATLLLTSRGTGIEFGDIRKITFDPGLELLPAISPDGQEVAFVATESGPVPGRVVVRSLVGGRTDVVSDEDVGSEEHPRWSPDGSTIFFHASGRVFEVPARGGTPRPIAPEGGAGEASYGVPSPGGDRIAYVRSLGDRSTIVVSSQAGETEVAEVDPAAHSLVWSPDGSWLAYVEGNATWVTLGATAFGNVSPSALKVVSAEGGTPVEIAAAQSLNVSPTFLPDGRLLYVSGLGGVRDVYVVELGRDGSARSEPTRVTLGLEPHAISVSADGRRLAYGTLARRQNVHRIEIPGSGSVSAYEGLPVTTGQQVIEGIAVSPDGEWLAIDSDRAGTQDVYRRRLQGGGAIQLTSLPSDEFVRSWSGDGTLVAGHGFNEGVRDVFVVDADGLSISFVDPNPAHDRYPDFSPDGRRIAFQSERGEGGIYLLVHGAGGAWEGATRIGPGQWPRWSPDGSLIVSSSLDSVWVTPSSGGESWSVAAARADGSVDAVEWDGPSDLVVLRRRADRTSVVSSLSLSSGAERDVIVFSDPARQPRSEMAVHAGQLYYTLGEFEADLWVVDLETR